MSREIKPMIKPYLHLKTHSINALNTVVSIKYTQGLTKFT